MAEQSLDEMKRVRLEKLEELKRLGVNPYPSKTKGVPIKIGKGFPLQSLTHLQLLTNNYKAIGKKLIKSPITQFNDSTVQPLFQNRFNFF